MEQLTFLSLICLEIRKKRSLLLGYVSTGLNVDTAYSKILNYGHLTLTRLIPASVCHHGYLCGQDSLNHGLYCKVFLRAHCIGACMPEVFGRVPQVHGVQLQRITRGGAPQVLSAAFFSRSAMRSGLLLVLLKRPLPSSPPVVTLRFTICTTSSSSSAWPSPHLAAATPRVASHALRSPRCHAAHLTGTASASHCHYSGK